MESSLSPQDLCMIEKASNLLKWSEPFIPRSGSFQVVLNRKELSGVGFDNQKITIELKDAEKAKFIIHNLPKRYLKLSFANEMSKALDDIGKILVIRDKDGELAELGTGVHSILGKIRLKVLRARKYL